MNLKDYIRDVPDFPKPGVLFKDITPLLNSPEAFADSVAKLSAHFAAADIAAIAAAEARGFLFAAPMALALRKPLVPLRKPGNDGSSRCERRARRDVLQRGRWLLRFGASG